MRALTVEELGFVSGGWNPYSNPARPLQDDEKSYQQRAFEATVRQNAIMEVRDQMTADLAGLLGGEMAGRVAGWVAGALGGNPATVVGSGEIASAGAEAGISAAAVKAVRYSRQFYYNMYYSILARYGL